MTSTFENQTILKKSIVPNSDSTSETESDSDSESNSESVSTKAIENKILISNSELNYCTSNSGNTTHLKVNPILQEKLKKEILMSKSEINALPQSIPKTETVPQNLTPTKELSYNSETDTDTDSDSDSNLLINKKVILNPLLLQPKMNSVAKSNSDIKSIQTQESETSIKENESNSDSDSSTNNDSSSDSKPIIKKEKLPNNLVLQKQLNSPLKSNSCIKSIQKKEQENIICESESNSDSETYSDEESNSDSKPILKENALPKNLERQKELNFKPKSNSGIISLQKKEQKTFISESESNSDSDTSTDNDSNSDSKPIIKKEELPKNVVLQKELNSRPISNSDIKSVQTKEQESIICESESNSESETSSDEESNPDSKVIPKKEELPKNLVRHKELNFKPKSNSGIISIQKKEQKTFISESESNSDSDTSTDNDSNSDSKPIIKKEEIPNNLVFPNELNSRPKSNLQ
ncbi:hypothetical protein JTE90_002104 [Oedothorax gibbosus]|uniref:Uncharacterized protein n=1 Tax=Oedothorax gibbosus TaxID=931172 RepID=A0AAV6V8J0_9ARAC|nr:hypothetical protein JTE90_002104 [Oedothorax gibbosus]